MKNFRRQSCDEAGTAFVETLVVVPVFAVILAGILALNAMYGAKLEAKARARQLAWLQADSGDCATQSCVGELCDSLEAQIRTGGLDAVLSAQSGRFSLGSLVGNVGQFLLGRVTHGVGLASAPLPGLLSSAQTTQRGRATLVCNTTSRREEPSSNAFDQACAAGLNEPEYASEACR